MIVPAGGGPEREVLSMERNFHISDRALDWSSDSRYLFVSDRIGNSYGISRVSVAAGERLTLTSPPAGHGDVSPILSPDGRAIAFIRDVGNSVSRLYVLKLRPDYSPASEPARMELLACSASLCQHPVWTGDGKQVLFVSNYGGPVRLWRAPASGGEADVLAMSGEGAMTPAVARIGQQLAFTRTLSDTSLWQLDLNSAKAGVVKAKPVIQSTREEHRPRVSPDGKVLAYESNGTGVSEIWLAAADGSNARPITNFGRVGVGSPSWSPDGSRLLFDSRRDGQAEIYELAVTGLAVRRLTTNDAADILPAYSPDSRWVYFASNRSGRFEIWRIPVHGGAAVQITCNGGLSFNFSTDGGTIYFTKNNPVSSLWAIPVNGGDEQLLEPLVRNRCFGAVSDGLYFISPETPSRDTLKFRNFRDGSVRTLFTFRYPVVPGFSFSADGKFAYYGQVDGGGSDLFLVKGFN
jgi:Tol biopolymer transport system component